MSRVETNIYVIYYTWSNTADNHAGMTYLIRQIKLAYPRNIHLIEVPRKWNSWHPKIKKLWHLLLISYFKIFQWRIDNILFMEYLGNRSGNQTGLALKLRKYGYKNKLIGLVHLSPSNLKELYEDDVYIKKSLKALDKILVFGTSLEQYFIKLGFRGKERRTFHYVDTDYYYPLKNKNQNKRLRVISMGSLKRNHELLKEIVTQCPFADFDICMGGNDYSHLFKGINNVTVYDYLPEKELLALMQKSDVSLSVLYDTVGSNVIVTSLATGLVNVVSNVGSIRDYCSENDSCLCSNIEDFLNALFKLSADNKLKESLSKNSLKKANEYSLKKFLKAFPEIIQ